MGLISSVFYRLFGKKQIKVLMLGLDFAGKTTILYKLKLGEIVQTIPTIGFNVETLEYKNISFLVYDVNGRDRIRPLWRHYFEQTQAIIFVVDCSDKERIPEAQYEILNLIKEDSCADAALLIFANKQDLPDALSPGELIEKLGLKSHTNKRWFVQATCAVRGEGLYEGLEWLSNELNKSS